MHIGYLFYPIFIFLMIEPLICLTYVLIQFGFYIKNFLNNWKKQIKHNFNNKPLWLLKQNDKVYIFAYEDEFIIGKVVAKMETSYIDKRYRFIIQDPRQRTFVCSAKGNSDLTWDVSKNAFITSSKTEILSKVYRELGKTKDKYKKRRYKDFMGQIAATQ